MTPPRWFYPLVAACVVVLTVAGVWRMVNGGRYVANGLTILDTRTGQRCYMHRTAGGAEQVVCRDMSRPNVVDPFADVPVGNLPQNP